MALHFTLKILAIPLGLNKRLSLVLLVTSHPPPTERAQIRNKKDKVSGDKMQINSCF